MVELEEFENYSDEDVDEKSHNKLLSAVSRLYKKQRVEKPERSEPYSNVSEFHLSKHSENNKIEIDDLVNVLNQKPSYENLKNKFKSFETSTKLPKPLEKFYADKVKRSVGYEHIKKHVSRWDGIVEKNQTAAQLSFPLNDESEVKVYKPLEFLHTFKEPTEMEKNMAEILQQSKVAEEDSKINEIIFDLSLPEMIKKRKLMAKLKARESFQIVKVMKQNKIKSKKYRRILRKEKVKQELKDFEILQRTDPEAVLEKLNKIDKERAEERASLRHRNTGKWARAQAIRAKYDVEARIQLAEQIAKSRELTQKNRNNKSSEGEEDDLSDEDDNENEQVETVVNENNDDNPWTKEANEQTMDDFVLGYQNYWKNKKKEPVVKPTINKAALARLVGKGNINVTKQLDVNTNGHGNKEICGDGLKEDLSNADNGSKLSNSCQTFNGEKEESNMSSGKLELMDGCNDTSDRLVPTSNHKVSIVDSPAGSPENSTKNIANKPSLKLLKQKKQVSRLNKVSNIESNSDNSFNDEEQEKSSHLVKNGAEISNLCSKETVHKIDNNQLEDEHPSNNTVNKSKKRKIKQIDKIKRCITNVSGSWNVETVGDSVSSNNTNKSMKNKSIAIDDIFDKMENRLHEKIWERLKKFDDAPDDEEKIRKTKQKKPKGAVNKNHDDERKPSHSQGNFIVETCDNDATNDKDKDLEDLLKVVNESDSNVNLKDGSTSKEPMIDPNKFLNVKPRLLNAQIPDMLTEGDDALDDPEDDRQMNISEAFAEDDVINEFSEEKNEEIKNSENQDIDLFLPGWGSWAGPNINLKAQQRKRKRFLIKAPMTNRKDSSKPNIIINDIISEKYKKHLVNIVPDPFTSVKDYEASIRAPIGSTWVPESAVTKLTKPPVVKKMGTVIQPMTEAYLMKNKNERSKFTINNIKKND